MTARPSSQPPNTPRALKIMSSTSKYRPTKSCQHSIKAVMPKLRAVARLQQKPRHSAGGDREEGGAAAGDVAAGIEGEARYAHDDYKPQKQALLLAEEPEDKVAVGGEDPL